MKEVIIQFRKTCIALGWTQKKIIEETHLSQPVIAKLLNEEPIPDRGIRASTIGILQDFNKRHVDDLAFNRDGTALPGKSPKVHREKKSKPLVPETGKKDPEERISESLNLANLPAILIEMSKLPKNIHLTIEVNGKEE